jgi:hypothetical protein
MDPFRYIRKNYYIIIIIIITIIILSHIYILQKPHGLPSAGESYDWTSCPHCGNPLDDTIHACSHRLLFCREILHGIDDAWANLVVMAGVPSS